VSDQTFDLGTNTSVPLATIQSDSSGNILIPGEAVVWTSDDESVITLTDNGDGTVTAVRVSADGGSVSVHASVTNADGSVVEGTISLSLAAQGAGGGNGVADVTIVPGTPS
jgi:hypothetical protein